MTHPKLTARERKVKALLLSGHSRHAIASKLRISKSTVYDIVADLEHYGEIRAIPGTKNPVVYEDPNYRPFIPPTEGCSEKSGNNGRAVQNNGPSGNCDELPEVDLKGICTGNRCPDGYVTAHMSGGIRFTKVRKTGTYDPIRDIHGNIIGIWDPEKPTAMKGNRVRSARITIFGSEMTLQFRIGSRGGTVFTVNPGRIHLDPRMFESQEEAKAVFIDRALYISGLLRFNGWQLTDPEIRGMFDYAIPQSPLVAHLPKGTDFGGSDIFVDTSPGVPEAEMSESKGLTDWEKVQIFANIPSEIQSLRARASHTEGGMESISRVVVSHQTRLDELDSVMSRVIDVQEKQTTALVNIVDQTTSIISAQGNINSAIAAGTQRQLDSFTTSVSGHDRTDSNNSHKPTHLEGYI